MILLCATLVGVLFVLPWGHAGRGLIIPVPRHSSTQHAPKRAENNGPRETYS
ncbi:MAG: hypothetical protein K0B14_17230 [Anaerolineaceae bacterium]|nr:hypothetical protein [Anaerolineaceae bacterium]